MAEAKVRCVGQAGRPRRGAKVYGKIKPNWNALLQATLVGSEPHASRVSMCQFYDWALTTLMFCVIYLFASVLAGS